MQAQEVKAMIEKGLPGAVVKVEGDGDHFNAIVICKEFAGKTAVRKHQIVYGTLGNAIQTNEIHALSIKTYTPEEWQALNK